VDLKERIGGRGRRAPLSVLIASLALPALAGCSSSSSVDYVADTYPSQSLADMLKGATAPAPPVSAQKTDPAPTAGVANTSALPTSSPSAPPPPAAATPIATATPAAAPPAAAADPDPVAAAYPSVSLIDLLTGAAKSPAP